MKLLTLLLAGLLLSALFNLALDLAQDARFRALLPLASGLISPPDAQGAFDQQLAATTDPADLRRLARAQYAKRLDRDRLIVAVAGSVDRMNGIATVRSAVLAALALGALVASRAVRAPLGAPHPE